jgi:hypothetical protein
MLLFFSTFILHEVLSTHPLPQEHQMAFTQRTPSRRVWPLALELLVDVPDSEVKQKTLAEQREKVRKHMIVHDDGCEEPVVAGASGHR